MPKQYVTIDEKRVAVSDITSKEKPFPFSANFHDLSIGEMSCDITANLRNIHSFEIMIELNQHQTDFGKSTREYAEKMIKELKKMNLDKQVEIIHRKKMGNKHKLRFGAN